MYTLSNLPSHITLSLQATRTTAVWTAICLSSMPISPFDRYPFSYTYVASYLPLTDARLPFPPLSIQLQVHCPFSAFLRRPFPLSTAIHPATGPLPSLCLSLTHFSPFHRYPFSYMCVARSLPITHYPIPYCYFFMGRSSDSRSHV